MLYFSEWGKTLGEEEQIKIEIVKDSREVLQREKVYKFGIQSDDLELLDHITKRLNLQPNIEAYKSYHNMVDIMNKGVNKAKAIEYLAKSMNIRREEIIMFAIIASITSTVVV